MRQHGGHSQGFSLVEMTAALAIFSISVAAILGVFAGCLRATGTSLNHTRAAFLAQGILEEALAESEFETGEETGDLSGALPGASWQRVIDYTEMDDLYEVRVIVTWPERGTERQVEFVTLAAER